MDDKLKFDDVDKDFKQSSARLIELKANRHVDDIPIDDDYWLALKKHQVLHGRVETKS